MRRTWQLFKSFGLGALPILKLRESLLKESRLTQNYLVLTISSCLIATFGLLIDSAAVIIGAMIIAPLMLPLRGFSFATLEGDVKLLGNSFTSITVGTLLAVISSWMVGLVISLPGFGDEVLSRTQPTLIDLLIAAIAGGISGYAKIRPAVGDALPGTAIAVALMPPLCVIGLALSQGEWEAAQGASLLYLTNLIGINLACLSVYVLGGYAGSNELSRTLSWGVSVALIALLAVPLGISFWQLLSQAQVNDSIQKILVTRAIADRQDVEVLNSKVNWKTKPPSVLLSIQIRDPVTPEEVAVVEQLLKNELGQPFKVVFYVTPSRLVESSAPSSKSD